MAPKESPREGEGERAGERERGRDGERDGEREGSECDRVKESIVLTHTGPAAELNLVGWEIKVLMPWR